MTLSIKTKYKQLSRIRWIARITSLLSILVLLTFFFGEDFVVSKIAPVQLIGFLFFPIGLVTGFILGWKWEILGGTISTASLFCFYMIYGLVLNGEFPRGIAFLIFSLPGFLFLASGMYGDIAIGRLEREKQA